MQKLKDLINQAEELSSNIHKLTNLNNDISSKTYKINLYTTDKNSNNKSYDFYDMTDIELIHEFVQRQIDKRQQKLDPIKKKIDLITELLLEEKNDG